MRGKTDYIPFFASAIPILEIASAVRSLCEENLALPEASTED